MTRRHFMSLTVIVATSISIAPTSQAQWVVLDPANLAQNTLTAVRTMEMIDKQVRQLQNEAQMLVNQQRNLTGLPFNVVDRLRATLATTRQLIAQTQGMAFEVPRLDAQFARLYPSQMGGSASAQLAEDARTRWQTILNGLQTAMQMQAQVAQNATGDEQVLSDLIGQSQAASGALQAMQATNQLLALQAKQAIQTQQLALTQGRAAALEAARQAAAVERGREVTRRFLGTGTLYTPVPVHFYDAGGTQP